MNKAELYGSAIISSTNNSTMPGMAARKAIRKKLFTCNLSTILIYLYWLETWVRWCPWWERSALVDFHMPEITQNYLRLGSSAHREAWKGKIHTQSTQHTTIGYHDAIYYEPEALGWTRLSFTVLRLSQAQITQPCLVWLQEKQYDKTPHVYLKYHTYASLLA